MMTSMTQDKYSLIDSMMIMSSDHDQLASWDPVLGIQCLALLCPHSAPDSVQVLITQNYPKSTQNRPDPSQTPSVFVLAAKCGAKTG
jgi:hypothetical protein